MTVTDFEDPMVSVDEKWIHLKRTMLTDDLLNNYVKTNYYQRITPFSSTIPRLRAAESNIRSYITHVA